MRTSLDNLTLEKAIEMGEYDPSFLAAFPEWSTLSKNIKWHYIRLAIKNRQRFLELNYAETFNILDFSKKPHLQKVLDNIQSQLSTLHKDEEKLRVEYT